jgi:hypothetical protein
VIKPMVDMKMMMGLETNIFEDKSFKEMKMMG